MIPISSMSEAIGRAFNQATEDASSLYRYLYAIRNGHVKPMRRNQHDWVKKPISKKKRK